MTDKIDLLTPVGHMVQGSPFEEQTKDMKGNPLTVKTGPNVGQLRSEYFFAMAIPKTDPQWAAFFQQIQAVAQAGFPGGESQLPTFAWKIKDGDDPKHASKVGFPGHWIVNCSSGFMPKVYTSGGASQIVDPAQLKRGDYIRAYISVRGNGQVAGQAGVYINPSMVELVGYGEEIITGPSGDAVFGGAPVTTLPAGASATPVASSTPLAVAAPAALAAPAAVAPVPAAAPAALAAPAAVAPALAAAPAALAAPAAVAPVPAAATMTAKAAGAPYASFIAQGWTDAQLVEQGYMIAGVTPATDFLNP